MQVIPQHSSHFIGCGTAEMQLNFFSEKASNDGDDEQVEDFDLEKSNILVFGPTGSGKTHIIKVLTACNKPHFKHFLDVGEFLGCSICSS